MRNPVDSQTGHVLADRQIHFAEQEWQNRSISSINGGSEDVRESILVGRKLGYLENDILRYVIRNFVIRPHYPGVDEALSRLNQVCDSLNLPQESRIQWHRLRAELESVIFSATEITDEVRTLFPGLRAFQTF